MSFPLSLPRSVKGLALFGALALLVGGALYGAPQRLAVTQNASSAKSFDIECSTDAGCPAGQYCSEEGVCRSPFACPAFLDARWTNGTDFTARGAFSDISNGEYLSLVPAGTSRLPSFLRRSWLLRVTGGPAGQHTYERALLRKLPEPMTAFAGRLRVNLSRVEPYFSCAQCSASAPVMLVGGYNSPSWPATNTWTRDLTVGATTRQEPPGVTPPPYPIIGGAAYRHENFGVGNPALYPLGKPQTWPDRMVDVDWYVTPAGNMYMRVDGQQWVHVSIPSSTVPPKERRLYGIALGWISSYSGGSVDIERFRLYPLSCSQKPRE